VILEYIFEIYRAEKLDNYCSILHVAVKNYSTKIKNLNNFKNQSIYFVIRKKHTFN